MPHGEQPFGRFLALLQLQNFTGRFFDGNFQIGKIYGLRNEIKGAPIHRRADVVHITIRRDNYSLKEFVPLGKACQQGQTIHHRHVDVGEDDVDVVAIAQRVQGLFAIARKGDIKFTLTDSFAEFLADQGLEIGFIIYDQQADRSGRTVCHALFLMASIFAFRARKSMGLVI